MIIRISSGEDTDDSRLISQWTKRVIIEAARNMVSAKDVGKLTRMPPEDLLSQLLVRDCDYLTGSATIPGACRTTTYWRIDWGYMREFLEGCI